MVIEDRGSSGDYELKYFTATTATSLDTEESRCDNSDDSRAHDYEDIVATPSILSDGPMEADTLMEEPELENMPDNDDEDEILSNVVEKKLFNEKNLILRSDNSAVCETSIQIEPKSVISKIQDGLKQEEICTEKSVKSETTVIIGGE